MDSTIEQDWMNTTIDGVQISDYEEVDLTAQNTAQVEEPAPLIAENLKTILVDESTSRFSSAEWFDEVQTMQVSLLGLGGIGSWVSLLLARLKPMEVQLVDPDRVEAVNLAGQLCGTHDLGKSKTSSAANLMKVYGGYYCVYAIPERAGTRTCLKPVTICGFDNMEARSAVFANWRGRYEGNPNAIFIDGRLNAEEFQVFCVTGTDSYLMDKYRDKWLFDDNEAEHTICSYKQTSFCANMIASVMINLFVNFVSNLCDPVIPRALPFMTSYDAGNMMFRTVMQ